MVNVVARQYSSYDSKIVPKVAFILHGEKSASVSAISCATKHSVVDGKIGLGTLCNAESIGNYFKNRSSGWLPEHVLVDDETALSWYTKRSQNTLWFRPLSSKKIICFNIELPPMIFLVQKSDSSLFNFTIGKNSRPSLSTRIYHSPLMNLYESGSLCLGSAALPSEISIDTIKDCEDCLLQSQFTHVNHDETLRGGASNKELLDYWSNKSRLKESVSVRELQPNGTVGEFLEGVL